MTKQSRRVLIRVLAIVFFLSGLFISLSILTYKKPNKAPEIIQPFFTKGVEKHRSTVEKYAKEYDVTDHIDIILAMMMQESGGRGNDPMQSSESLCGTVGCIDDPELSIKQGVSYFSETLEAAEGDLKLAIQSYNFGPGFINYVKNNSGSYSEQMAIEFSQAMYKNAEDQSIYTCLRKEAKQYDACYGDILYVHSVLSYREMFAVK